MINSMPVSCELLYMYVFMTFANNPNPGETHKNLGHRLRSELFDIRIYIRKKDWNNSFVQILKS